VERKAVKASPNRVIIGYSGDMATSIGIPWLREHGHAEVIAVAVDVGQGREINQVRERAIAAGASRCHVLDARQEFAREYLLRALQAGTMREPCQVGLAMEAPLIAKKLVEIARMEHAAVVAHGAAGGRLGVAIAGVDPAITTIALAGVWNMTASEQVEYASARNLPVPPAGGVQKTRQNLWGRAVYADVLHDRWNEAPDHLYTLTRPLEQAPTTPAYAELEWVEGVPVCINGVSMPLTELIDSLETIAGAHGVGRTDCRLTGGRPQLYESPVGVVLDSAHAALEGLMVPADLQRLKGRLLQDYADLIERGSWFSPARDALDAFMQSIQRHVTGTVRMKLYKGSCRAVGVRSDTPRHADDTDDTKRGAEATAK
jgi:argininosuccinate synthase